MNQLPKQVDVVEVGPRDGFQNISEFIPTEAKLQIINALIEAGIRKMEITSYVHPKAIPQMVDAVDVTKMILDKQYSEFQPIALIPNLYGAKKAHQLGIKEVTYVISVSEAHNQANIKRTHDQSFAELKQILEEIPELKVRVDAATAFGCPFAGKVSDEWIKSFMDRVAELGIKEVILCDTIGVANPAQVTRIIGFVRKLYPEINFGLHLHDTRGMGLANTLAGLQAGITTIEVAVGGLGGCPFAPGASGNTATEDLLNMLHEMQIETGIDMELYMKAVELVKTHIKPGLTSHMATVYKNTLSCG